MEYIVEETKEEKKVGKEEKIKIADKITKLYSDYDNARKEVLEYARKLSDEIYFRHKFVPEKGKKDWKSRIKMCKMFMYFMTYKAFIWKNTYSSVNSMFDVSGDNMEADEMANQQKANLVNIFEKMKFSNSADDVIDYSLIYGELIAFITWTIKKEEYRRPIGFFQTMFQEDVVNLPKILQAISQGKKYWVDEREVYNNAKVIPINPENFVFDASQFEQNPDACPKICRSWKTVDEIANNLDYELSKAEIKELRGMVQDPPNNEYGDQEAKSSDEQRRTNGTTIEVLDYYGTYTLDDGTTLPNWHATVIAGKFLALFEKNKFIINPFVYGTYFRDPKTGRGISPLYSGLDLALCQEKMLNQTVDLQTLNENKPILSPKGFFKEEEVEMYPGKIIEFDPALYSNNQISPINFETTIYKDDISFLAETMSEVTGIFPNMTGNEESSRRTATEISVKTQGQTTRLSMVLDTIQQYFIIPTVEKVAKMNANIKFGAEKLFFDKDNQKEEILINDAVRQADYKYTYKDRNAIQERFNFADMIVMAVERFAKFIPLDVKTLFKWYMEQKGVENPEKFLQQMPEIPLPVQQELMKRPDVQQVIAGFQQQQQAQGGEQPKAPSEQEGQLSPLQEAAKLRHLQDSPTEFQ